MNGTSQLPRLIAASLLVLLLVVLVTGCATARTASLQTHPAATAPAEISVCGLNSQSSEPHLVTAVPR